MHGESCGRGAQRRCAGFSTASVPVHRTSSGAYTPSFGAAQAELMAVATAIRRAGRGIIQMLIDFSDGDPAAHIEFMKSYRALLEAWLRSRSRRSIAGRIYGGRLWRSSKRQSRAGCDDPRTGVSASDRDAARSRAFAQSITLCPSYAALASLSLERKVQELRQPDVRRRLSLSSRFSRSNRCPHGAKFRAHVCFGRPSGLRTRSGLKHRGSVAYEAPLAEELGLRLIARKGW